MDHWSTWTNSLLFFAMAEASIGLIIPYPACLLMQRAACFTPLPGNSCVLRINNTTVTIPLKDEYDTCKEDLSKLTKFGNCIDQLSGMSSYVGITNNYDPSYKCVSRSCSSPTTGSEKMHTGKFPMTTGGLCVMFLSGMLSGILITFFIVFLYLKWKKTQPTKEDNTYVDLDISEAENEEQPAVEYTQRGSVAFVREIASVYYKDVDIEKDRPASTRSKIFSWAASKSSRKSVQERKSSINRNVNSLSKNMFAYEQPVPEEEHLDSIDLDSPGESNILQGSTENINNSHLTGDSKTLEKPKINSTTEVGDKIKHLKDNSDDKSMSNHKHIEENII